jgi:FtsP/CotA-like multicopper oxidase with cupredoxin domain
MSRSQRLTFLGLAAVIAVVAVVILVVAGGGGSDSSSEATAGGGPLLTAAKEQDITATEGDTVRFRVKADADEEVHVHGYNIEKEIPAGKTIAISFKATITGIFEIEFHHSGATLARLKVEPK